MNLQPSADKKETLAKNLAHLSHSTLARNVYRAVKTAYGYINPHTAVLNT